MPGRTDRGSNWFSSDERAGFTAGQTSSVIQKNWKRKSIARTRPVPTITSRFHIFLMIYLSFLDGQMGSRVAGSLAFLAQRRKIQFKEAAMKNPLAPEQLLRMNAYWRAAHHPSGRPAHPFHNPPPHRP